MAGALSRRDIEMIFRADTDKATRPIGDLTKDVRQLRTALEEQVRAADKGDVSLDKLAATTRDLKKAQDELGTARSMLTSLNSQVAALDKAEAKLESASSKYAELRNQVDQAEKPTKRLTNSLEAAGRAEAAAAENVRRLGAEVAETRQRVESVIGPVSNFQDSFKQIADTSKEIARGLAVAGDATDDFKQKLVAAEQAQNKLASDQSFQQTGLDAGLLQSQIDYISQFENRVELLNQAKRELTQQNAAFDQALRAQEAVEGAANVNKLRAAFEATAAEQRRIESVDEFRQIAANANAAAVDVSRFGATSETTATSANRLADSILAIVSPSAAANKSIEGLEGNVERAAGVLEGNRRSATEYNNAMNDLSAATAAASRVAGQIDGYRDQEAALARSTARMGEARAEVQRLAAVIPASEKEAADLTKQLRQAEAALEATGQEVTRDATKLAQLSVALEAAGVDVKNLTQAELRLAQAARQAAAAQDEIRQKVGGSGNPFGFSLNDMQNLGYQVNDLITQVASGTSVMQAFAQQGGQIYQIPAIQNLIARYAALIPIVLAAGAAIITVANAVGRVNDAAAELRNAEGYMAMLGEQGSLTAEQMAEASIKMQDMGVAVEDARKALRTFNEEGLDPQYLDSYMAAAQNASDITGVDFATSFDTLTEAMTGGYDEVVKLNDMFPVLTDAEMQHIRAMMDSGNESEARRIIFERFYDKMEEGASNMRGPWTNAVNSFKQAFQNFLDWLGSTTVLQNFINNTNNALTGLNYLLLRARGFSYEEAGKAAVNGGRPPRAPRPAGGAGPAGNRPKTTVGGQNAVADAERELDVRKRLTNQQRLENAAIDARRKALAAGYSESEVAQLANLARTKEQKAIDDEAAKAGARSARAGASAARKAEAERRKAQNAAEALQRKIDGQIESLTTALDRMNSQVARSATGSLSEQMANAVKAVDDQYARLYRQLDEFSKLAGSNAKINGMSQDEYRKQLDTNKQILSNQAQLTVYENQLTALVKQRSDLLADIEERASRGAISSADAARQASEVTSRLNPLIANLGTAAKGFAATIGGAKLSPELEQFVAKMDRAIGQASVDGPNSERAQVGMSRLGAEEQALNQILQERNALVASYNTLVELGMMSQADAQQKTADAFNNSIPLIETQLGKIRQLIDYLREQGLITDQLYNTWIAKMQAVDAQAQYTNANVLAINNLVQGQLLNGGMALFESLAQGLADLATGTGDVGDAFSNLLTTFLNFAATFLLEIGKMIAQTLILSAIQSALGMPGGSGGLGALFFHSGTGPGGVGGGSGRRTRSGFSVSPAIIDSIPRYHKGTAGAGLKNNEMLAVLERGEKVLTEEQQRKEAALGSGGGNGATGLRQVLAFGDDQVAAAMQGPAGERTTVTHIRRNVPLLKQLLRD